MTRTRPSTSPDPAAPEAERVVISVGEARSVSGLWLRPAGASACCVLAHGAGAGMTHPFLEAVATGLARRGIATLRYQFPFMEAGSRRPDPPRLAHAAVRAAVAEAARLAPDLPLVAGGKSFGGRMTSQAEALAALPGVGGLTFLGFPLHPPKRPSVERGRHLSDVAVPMLFLQGTRDALAEPDCLRLVCDGLGERATLHWIDGADHGFAVPVRSGRTAAEARDEMLDVLVRWIEQTRQHPSP